jgi:hypothetical protein
MKFFIDLSKKQLVKSAASNVALDRVVFKRRDQLAIEVTFVARGAAATMPEETTIGVAIKKSFSEPHFLALASGNPLSLNLYTVPLEAAFSASPASINALLEIAWRVDGETSRTATLLAEIQNSVILGGEGEPAVIPDGRASQEDAESGLNNDRWMTPLRTAQAISALAPPAVTSISDTPPENPREGSRWINTFDAVTYEYIGGAWVETTAS